MMMTDEQREEVVGVLSQFVDDDTLPDYPQEATRLAIACLNGEDIARLGRTVEERMTLEHFQQAVCSLVTDTATAVAFVVGAGGGELVRAISRLS